MNIPSIIAEYRNSITAEKPLPPADAEYSKSLMDAFTTGDAPTRKQKIYEMTKDILENNPRLKSKISEEKTADEIAKEFADKTDGYTFMREDVFDVPDAANKGVMYIREKTE